MGMRVSNFININVSPRSEMHHGMGQSHLTITHTHTHLDQPPFHNTEVDFHYKTVKLGTSGRAEEVAYLIFI